MTDLDVALRVRLAYDGAAAKPAVADMEAIRAGAARVGAQTGPALAARGLGELGRQAAVSKVGIEQLTGAGSRLDAVAQSARSLTGDMRQAGMAAIGAGQAVRAVDGLGGAPSAASSTAALSDPEAGRLQAAIKARRAAGGFINGADLEAFLKGFDHAPAAADGVARPADTPSGAQRAVRAASAPSILSPKHDGQIGTAAEQRAVAALGRSADKLGASVGAGKLAEGIAAVSLAATEARRHVDDIGAGARTALRDLERMGQAASGAGGGAGGGGGHDEGPAGGAGGGRHAGPGGLRGALIAGARPLRMERLVMSAFTPIGLAGLAGGLGLAEVGRQMKAVEEQAASFETAMVGVRRAVGDMPAEGVKALEKTILGVSSATGASKEELAELTAAAVRAGRPLADLPRFLDVGAKAAGVMGIKVDEAGERLVTLGKGWGKDQAGIEDTVNAVALASEKTGAKSADVLDFTTRHSDMRARNMSARQVAAFGAGFQGAGLDAGQAEGAFSSLSEKLTNPQNAGPQFEKDLNLSLGINPTQARVGMRSDPTRQMVDVLDKLKTLPEGKRENVLERMFGAEGGKDIGRVVDHLDELKRTLGLVEDQGQRSGALERAFKVFDDTTNAKIDKAGKAFEGFAARLGAKFLPAVKAAADGTARLFDGLSRYMDRSDQADAIQTKQEKGEPLTPAEKQGVDHDPQLRQFLGMDPDPAATVAASARKRAAAEKTIRDLEKSAKENDNDPQIRAMIDQAKQEYRQDFPGAPLPAFAAGGRVTGPGGPRDDKVHAMLSHGEFVIRASSAAKHHGLVKAINDDALPAFATGGVVGALAADPAARSGAPTLDRLGDAIEKAVKAGVVAGLREAVELRPSRGGPSTADLVRQSETGGGGGEIGGEGAGGGAPNLRYGRAGSSGGRYRAAPAGPGRGGANLRYGRAGAGGYRDTPAGHGGPEGVVPTGAHDPLKDLIATHETGGTGAAGYDTVYGHAEQPGSKMAAMAPPKPITQMTIGEVLAYQRQMKPRAGSPAFPVGRAQWTESTLRGLTRGMDPNTKLTPEVQERLFDKSIAGRMGQGPKGFRSEWDSLRGVGDGTIQAAIDGHRKALAQAPAPAAPGLATPADGPAAKGQYPTWMNDRSKRELSAVNAGLARDLLAASKDTGIRFNVAQGLRSQGEANANARSGRGVRDSQHLYGAAADLHMLDAQGRETYDRAAYKRFGDAFEKLQRQHGQAGRWLGNLPGRWGSDIVHFDQGIGYGQTHKRAPYGAGGPTKDDVAAGNRDAFTSPQNPFLKRGTPTPAAPAPVAARVVRPLVLAAGGRVSGPGGPRDDKVAAMLSHGEFVVNAAAAAKHPTLVRAINDDALPAFADGGAVPRRPAGDPAGQARVHSWLDFFTRAKQQGGMGARYPVAVGAAAMMQGESGRGLNPNGFGWDVNGPSGGTAQWHDVTVGRGAGKVHRLSDLQTFAMAQHADWHDVGVQQAYWKHEAEGPLSYAWKAMRKAPNAAAALKAGVEKFEVPADKPGEVRKRTPNIARILRDEGRSGGGMPARFADPGAKPSRSRMADMGGQAAGITGGQASGGPAPVQHFYGMHDPAVTARRAMLESNREVRRSQARALHSVGRVA